MTAYRCDIAVVGAGLTGLAAANALLKAGRDVHVFEARDRVGGRILSRCFGSTRFDLGPAWLWPGQTRAAALAADLGLTLFEQYATGDLIFEDGTHPPQRHSFATMAGAFRLSGGMAGLTDGLAARIPEDRVHLNQAAKALAKDGTVTFGGGDRVKAQKIVLALPPRLAAQLTWQPALPAKHLQRMSSVPTWMAGHAKIIALYPRAFWRDDGLSGDAISRVGPLAEIHDASGPAPDDPAALFGFVGVPAHHRRGQAPAIRAAAVQQLTRLFGPNAATPDEIWLADWSEDPATADAADAVPPPSHPDYRPLPALPDPWTNCVHICSSETAPDAGGLVEGALAAAQAAVEGL